MILWTIKWNHYHKYRLIALCFIQSSRFSQLFIDLNMFVDLTLFLIIQEAEGHEGAKPQRAIYLRNDLIFTTGFSRMSERQYSLRSEAALGEPIVLETLDTSNGVLFPFYDCDVNLLYLCAKVSILL